MNNGNLTLHVGVSDSWLDLSFGPSCVYVDEVQGVTLSIDLVESLGLEPDVLLERLDDNTSIFGLRADAPIVRASLASGFGPGAVRVRRLRLGEVSIHQITACSVRGDVALFATASVPSEAFAGARGWLIGILRAIDVVRNAGGVKVGTEASVTEERRLRPGGGV